MEKDLTEVDRKNPYERFAINLAQSINIGVDRKIPDNRFAKIRGSSNKTSDKNCHFRPEECASQDWTKLGPLPDVSVIITFRDEPRSTLLRTVVSETLDWSDCLAA